MKVTRKKVEAGLRKAMRVGRDTAQRALVAGDDALTKLGEAARRRQRARKSKSAMKQLGKAVLVTGAVVAAGAAVRRSRARAK